MVTIGSSGSGTVAAIGAGAAGQGLGCSPRGSRVGAVEVLQVGQQVAEVLGVQPLAAATDGGWDLGPEREGRLGDHAAYVGEDGVAQGDRVGHPSDQSVGSSGGPNSSST